MQRILSQFIAIWLQLWQACQCSFILSRSYNQDDSLTSSTATGVARKINVAIAFFKDLSKPCFLLNLKCHLKKY